jgi:hypothetical protein
MIIRRLLVLVGVAIGTMAASAVAADPRDSVERSQRLDTDALRDDVSSDRLRVPSHPLTIAPAQQPAPTAKGKKKSNATSGSIR